MTFSQGYANWASGAISIPGTNADTEEKYYPVTLPSAFAGVGSLTQPGVQSGVIGDDVIDSLLGSDSDSEPGTDDDVQLFPPGSIGGTAWSSFTDWLDSWWSVLIDSILSLHGNITAWFDDLVLSVKAIPSAFSTWLERLIAGVESILDTIGAIPASIAEAIAAVFIPSSDYITVKVDALLSRFDWITPIVGYAKALSGEFLGSTPPVIYVHLEDSEGSYNLGGTVKFLDMTWYSRYKAQGDAIISGFLWALFVWRMYIKLPGIINGVAGDIGSMTYGEAKWQQADNREKRRNRDDK